MAPGRPGEEGTCFSQGLLGLSGLPWPGSQRLPGGPLMGAPEFSAAPVPPASLGLFPLRTEAASGEQNAGAPTGSSAASCPFGPGSLSLLICEWGWQEALSHETSKTNPQGPGPWEELAMWSFLWEERPTRFPFLFQDQERVVGPDPQPGPQPPRGGGHPGGPGRCGRSGLWCSWQEPAFRRLGVRSSRALDVHLSVRKAPAQAASAAQCGHRGP